MKVKLVSYTQVDPNNDLICDSEALIAFCARVSNKSNQENWKTAPQLIRWLVEHDHWSPLEMVNVCMEITTTRAISAQIMRHRSFSFQELSQRYTKPSIDYPDLRIKGSNNRQGSLNTKASGKLHKVSQVSIDAGWEAYNHLVENGVALESARMVLPMCTETTIYMNGTLRSWIHYTRIREEIHTQKEHRDIANGCSDILKELYPNVMKVIYSGSL